MSEEGKSGSMSSIRTRYIREQVQLLDALGFDFQQFVTAPLGKVRLWECEGQAPGFLGHLNCGHLSFSTVVLWQHCPSLFYRAAFSVVFLESYPRLLSMVHEHELWFWTWENFFWRNRTIHKPWATREIFFWRYV